MKPRMEVCVRIVDVDTGSVVSEVVQQLRSNWVPEPPSPMPPIELQPTGEEIREAILNHAAEQVPLKAMLNQLVNGMLGKSRTEADN